MAKTTQIPLPSLDKRASENAANMAESCRAKARNFIIAAELMDRAGLCFEKRNWNDGLGLLQKANACLGEGE